MQHKHIAFIAGAVLAYFYFSGKSSAQAQTTPLVSSLYNVGYNFASGGGFSLASPVATPAS